MSSVILRFHALYCKTQSNCKLSLTVLFYNAVADSLDCNVTSDGVTSISALCHSQDPGVTGFQLIVDNSGPKDARRFSVNHTDDPSSPVVVQVEENGPECLAIVFAIKGENGVLYSNSSFYMGNIQLGELCSLTYPIVIAIVIDITGYQFKFFM